MNDHLEDPHTKAKNGTGIIVSDHFNENDTYFIKRPNGMKDWLITFTLSGEGYFKIQGEEKRVKAGDLAIIKSDTPHQYGTRKGQNWNFQWVHFIPSAQKISWMQLPEFPKGFFRQSIDNTYIHKRIYRVFKRIIYDNRQAGPLSDDLCMNALNEILLLILQNIKKPIDPRVADVIHILTERLTEPLQIEALAQAVGLSPSRISHLFKTETGLSIVETLIQMRLRQAALLLQHSTRNAVEIALDVGFQNYNHFANQFKTQYGVNPSSYRKDVH
ncbi:helix-turn-helix domain-containing protein [Paenibacillus sp. GP183]|uniref:helix-turn-helix domain-containing protein n=1 Tax=Paenibacillus sp. GP183 TaxID=1882751 RepID=UPI00089CB666|nr:helix-turn-helix domain-containing protein [Paenibacillus sp. GP183]SEB40009.1 AraC family transcriptional regulator, arabinose operon regulatory protein [Paenibacillus sp. GP183]